MEESYTIHRCVYTGIGRELYNDVPEEVTMKTVLAIASGKFPEEWTCLMYHDRKTGMFYQIDRTISERR